LKRETDSLTVMLLLAVVYLLFRDRQREAVLESSVIDTHCAYCDFESSAHGSANIRRSLNAHMRQIHPDEWRKLTLQKPK
jgi:hypothetical protein